MTSGKSQFFKVFRRSGGSGSSQRKGVLKVGPVLILYWVQLSSWSCQCLLYQTNNIQISSIERQYSLNLCMQTKHPTKCLHFSWLCPMLNPDLEWKNKIPEFSETLMSIFYKGMLSHLLCTAAISTGYLRGLPLFRLTMTCCCTKQTKGLLFVKKKHVKIFSKQI